MHSSLKSRKFLVLVIILVAVASFAVGDQMNNGTFVGQTVVWTGTAWQPLDGVFYKLDSSTVCFSSACDQNISWNGTDFIVSSD